MWNKSKTLRWLTLFWKLSVLELPTISVGLLPAVRSANWVCGSSSVCSRWLHEGCWRLSPLQEICVFRKKGGGVQRSMLSIWLYCLGVFFFLFPSRAPAITVDLWEYDEWSRAVIAIQLQFTGKQLLGKLQCSVLRTSWYSFLQRICHHLCSEVDLNWSLWTLLQVVISLHIFPCGVWHYLHVEVFVLHYFLPKL